MDAPVRFAQIIEFETDRIDEIRRLAEEADERFAGREHGPVRRLVLQDRNQPHRYLVVIEFDSHEDAVRNNDDPDTGKLAEQMAALCTRPPAFTDCDVQERADFT
ncbi:hypothetical protein JS756_07800 [Streptomyces actuosus]|uniref:Antibiotic biosynthesis monooxygenase n=1 Tax=Streptomyces actuosus TaxID=1885 RepID=A0ABS2VLS3_STRAS|nr:hypothetical protein [Streptomyces actuosus]MBN0044014.1 hypothetical protein [Streptomyces actuosus]